MANRRPHSGNCALCGTFRKSLHRDHIIPRFEGGSDDDSNLQLICANCHEDKTALDLKRVKRSPEVRARVSASLKAYWTPERKRAHSEKLKANWHSDRGLQRPPSPPLSAV